MNKKNILVFPCGSEIGLEIYRALRYCTQVNIIGASSVDDHGRFVYEQYIPGLPNVNHPDFIAALADVVRQNAIDGIYPTMDKVIDRIKQCEAELKCVIISSSMQTTAICSSKRATYDLLASDVVIPTIYSSAEAVKNYPVFCKPDSGYGSRGAKQIHSRVQLDAHLQEYPESIIMELLPGAEYTIDCFSNYKGELLFAAPRERKRIMNGISVNTATVASPSSAFHEIAKRINARLPLRGAWFFQVKENSRGDLALLEVASRFGGTSSVHRIQGVNFALLSVFDAFGFDVSVRPNSFNVEVDRALDNRYKLDITFDTVYVDLDDTLVVNDKLNLSLITLIYQLIEEKKKIILLTKHARDIGETMNRFRISGLFDEVIHIGKGDHKSDHIREKNAIFIDDSFAERNAVLEKLNIPVFAPDAVESLIK